MKYPLEPLAAALHITLNQTGRHHHDTTQPAGTTALAQALGLTDRAIDQARQRGGWTDPTTAERHALHIGRHPATIWPGWDQDIPDRWSDADWFPDDPPLDQLDRPPCSPLQPTLVA